MHMTEEKKALNETESSSNHCDHCDQGKPRLSFIFTWAITAWLVFSVLIIVSLVMNYQHGVEREKHPFDIIAPNNQPGKDSTSANKS